MDLRDGDLRDGELGHSNKEWIQEMGKQKQ
jgi:hypothetical protein